MFKDPLLSGDAVSLLFEVLEMPEPILSAAAANFDPLASEELTALGFLVPHDYEEVTASRADHDDVPVALTWYEQAGGLTYFSPAVGPVRVAQEQLLRRRVNVSQTLGAMAIGFGLPKSHISFELIEGLLWEVGDARLGKRTSRVPVWFARRLWSRTVQQQVADAVRRRPHLRHRVVLTSSRPDRVGDITVPGATVVPLRDVLARPDALAVDVEILGARLSGVPTSGVAGPIALSPDGTQLSINGGDPIPFRSALQTAAIRKLVAAYQSGQRFRAIDITPSGNLSNLFGLKKWKLLQPVLRSRDGLWSFEP